MDQHHIMLYSFAVVRDRKIYLCSLEPSSYKCFHVPHFSHRAELATIETSTTEFSINVLTFARTNHVDHPMQQFCYHSVVFVFNIFTIVILHLQGLVAVN